MVNGHHSFPRIENVGDGFRGAAGGPDHSPANRVINLGPQPLRLLCLFTPSPPHPTPEPWTPNPDP